MTDARVDHLVVAAARLEDGVAWCEATLGVVPGAGGRHDLFGTHNRLLAIGSEAFPEAYLEIIAIDPDAAPPPRPRWFGLDEPVLRERLARDGPAFIHVVARCADVRAPLARLQALGIDAGEPMAARRQTPRGWLEWEIAVPRDGRLPGGGAVPTWIHWPGAHPASAMPRSGLVLRRLSWRVTAPLAAACALAAVEIEDVAAAPGATAGSARPADPGLARPGLPSAVWRAELDTPLGPVTLESA